MPLQRLRSSVDDCVALRHGVGLRRDEERCRVHGVRLRRLVVVLSHRGLYPRQGRLPPRYDLLVRVREVKRRFFHPSVCVPLPVPPSLSPSVSLSRSVSVSLYVPFSLLLI